VKESEVVEREASQLSLLCVGLEGGQLKGTGCGTQLGHLDERRGYDKCLVCWHVGNMLKVMTDSWGLKSTLLSYLKKR
jgi:hypothetical protein